jgi:hypothetical protein
MKFPFDNFLGAIILAVVAYFGYMLLLKIITKVYHWIRWQRMTPTERKYEKIRQNRRRTINANRKKSYDASPDSPSGGGD